MGIQLYRGLKDRFLDAGECRREESCRVVGLLADWFCLDLIMGSVIGGKQLMLKRRKGDQSLLCERERQMKRELYNQSERQ
jgi:hypothetical protein